MMRDVEVDEREVIERWVTKELGGRVVSLEQQPRWRPMWPVDVDIDGEVLPMIVRQERVDAPMIFPLEHEMVLQRTIHEHGLVVPKVYGWIDELPAYVMERVGGHTDFTRETDEQRRQVTKEYMTFLAHLHRLPVEHFANAGIQRAGRPQDSGTYGMQQFERTFRSQKLIPDPLMEFVLGWLRRHPLPPHDREAVIVWDSGQFHHEDGHLVAALDVEIGHIGDPLMDLSAFRMRDTVLHYGDMNQMYQDYVDAGGFELDWTALRLHHTAFTLSNTLSFHRALAKPTPDSDYMTNLQWCCETNLHAIEAVADGLGVDLPDVEIPDARRSVAAVRHEHQVSVLGSVRLDDPFLAYKLRGSFRLARHLQRVDEIGAAIEQADLDDLKGLLGYRPRNGIEGAAALEDYVLADDGAHDNDLIPLFYRRLRREHATLGPPGSAMATHHVVKPFDSTASKS